MHGIFWYNNNIHGGKDYSKEQQHTHGYRDESTPMWPSTIDVFYRPYVTLHCRYQMKRSITLNTRIYVSLVTDPSSASQRGRSMHSKYMEGSTGGAEQEGNVCKACARQFPSNNRLLLDIYKTPQVAQTQCPVCDCGRLYNLAMEALQSLCRTSASH